MSQPQSSYTARDAIGAIRLAVEATAEGNSLRKALIAILELAPPTDPSNTYSVAMLVDAVRAAGGEFALTDDHPKGRLTKGKNAA